MSDGAPSSPGGAAHEIPVSAPDVPGEPLVTVEDYRRLLLEAVPIVDVRAPVEFAKGAFPASVNLPIMNDEERRQVGLRYKQAGQQSAIALGAELVDAQTRAARTAAWADAVNAQPTAVLSCFRGGLRSLLAQSWLNEAGVTRPLVAGGYKAMRTFLLAELERLCRDLPMTLIGGRTGVGKTLLLERLDRTVDLEGIAHHRGSSFGGMAEPQPSPIDVENRIGIALMHLDEAVADDASLPERRVWLEDEGKLVGRVCLPLPLREAMQRAPLVVLTCTLEQRVRNCFDDYVPDLLARYRGRLGNAAGFDAFAMHHRDSLARIRKRFGTERWRHARELLDTALAAHREHDDTSGYAAFIETLLTGYYDPMYDYQLAGKLDRVQFEGDADAIIEHQGQAFAASAREQAVPP